MKKYSPLLLGIAMLVICPCIYGQINIKHYMAADGLAHDVTYNIFQDSKGYIWICTDDGLSRFNGRTFKNYGSKNGLTSNYVMDIEELHDYTFAVSTWGGGVHFLKNDSLFKSSKYADDNSKIHNISVLNDTLYAASSSLFYFYDLKDSVLYQKSYLLNEGFSDDMETFFDRRLVDISISNTNKFIHDRNSFQGDFLGIKKITKNNQIEPAFTPLDTYKIGAILQRDSLNYVFGSDSKIIFVSDEKIEHTATINSISKGYRIVKILNSPDKPSIYFLVARDENGFKNLYKYDKNTNLTTDLVQELNMSTTVSDALLDFEGNLWVTTFGNGVYCYKYSSPKINNQIEGNYVSDILVLENTLYALTPSKLFSFQDEHNFKSYPINGFAKKLAIVNDSLFVSVLNPMKNEVFKDFTIISGRFYGESIHGRIRQSDTIFVNEKPIYHGNEFIVNAIEDSENSIHFYTNKGKWNHTIKQNTFVNDPDFLSANNPIKIQGFRRVDDKKYILSDKGFYILEKNNITNYTEKEGLRNDRINDLLIKDEFYLATQDGVSIIKDDKVHNISKSSGLKSLAINGVTFFKDKLWLGGDNGISIIDKESLKETPLPRLNITQHDTHFTYDAISFEGVGVTTAYRLNENDWIILNTSTNSIDFSTFAYDNYKVQFRSRKDNSDWALSEVYQFSIKAPWYHTWWILLSITLCIIAIITAFVLYRLRLISQRNHLLKTEMDKRMLVEKELGEVRDNIARDFHDDLGNKLASISLLSDVLLRKVDAAESDVLNNIKEDADYLYKGTKDFIFSLQDKSNYLDEVVIYLVDFAEDYLYQFGVSFEVESNLKKKIKLPHYWSKQIIYIFKEALTNTVKHASAKQVKMNFEFDRGTLEIICKDDGKGFDMENVIPNGLANMTERARKIQCKLDIFSKHKVGTKIVFNGKLPQ